MRCPERGVSFNVYRSGSGGAAVLALHGGGYSGLSWAPLARTLRASDANVRLVAPDLRGHGETSSAADHELSAESQVADVCALWKALFGAEQPAPPTVLLGHSMGGAVAAWVAARGCIPSLAGLVVVDVVEGTALSSLPRMSLVLQQRPPAFASLAEAVTWALETGLSRSPEAAAVSVPAMLRRALLIRRSPTPAVQLDRLASSEDEGEGGDEDETGRPAHLPPIVENSGDSGEEGGDAAFGVGKMGGMEVGESIEVGEKAQAAGRSSSPPASPSSLPPLPHPANLPPIATGAARAHSSDAGLPPRPPSAASPRQRAPSSPARASPRTAHEDAWVWRTPLESSRPHWQGWFQGLSEAFLGAACPKVLVLAGTDRLDKPLTIAQMQGRFQLVLLPRAGHAVHEDEPESVAEVLRAFLKRHGIGEEGLRLPPGAWGV